MKTIRRPITLFLIMATVTLAVLAWVFLPHIQRLLSNQDTHEPAAIHPPETLLYAWFTLQPEEEQKNSALRLWNKLNTSAPFQDTLEDLELTFTQNNAGLDFREDILSWAGPQLSVALVDPHPDNPEQALVITTGVRHPDRALAFLTTWTRHQADRTGLTFQQGAHRDFQTWSTGPTGHNYALSDQMLVYAQEQANLETVIERSQQNSELPTLASQQDYRDASASLPRPHSGLLYLNIPELFSLATSNPRTQRFQGNPTDSNKDGPGDLLPGSDNVPPWLAASLHLEKDAVTISIATPAESPANPDIPAPTRVQTILPRDTLVFLSVPFNPDTDSWRARLSEAGPLQPQRAQGYNSIAADIAQTLGMEQPPTLPRDADNADVLDLAITLTNNATGLDLEQDLLNHLAGTLAIALLDTDLTALAENYFLTPVNLALLLSHGSDSVPDLQDTLNRTTALIQAGTGMQPDTVQLDTDTSATVFNTGLPYQPSYMLHQQHLIIAATQEALEDIAVTGKTDGTQLESDQGYQRASLHLTPQDHVLAYANLNSLIDALPQNQKPRGMPETTVPTLRSTLDRLLVGTHRQTCQQGQEPECPVAHLDRTTLVITLFPEQLLQ